MNKTRRHFTQAARDAAALARRARAEARHSVADHRLFVVVVRAAGEHLQFCWEIRRFGALHAVRSSGACFASPQLAEAAGAAVLQELRQSTAAE